ncbi:hypothetical protein RND81_12G194600 [Saponaria officinalis]|uniref:Denticleless protein homolog n=1 Tax=Saponaria officinalis TaxID=3572 RepID=A0AAW1HCW1_SAPOF
MDFNTSQSILHHIKSTELHGFKGRKRPVFTFSSSFDCRDDKPSCSFGVSSSHDGFPTPPLALSFAKTIENAHILGVTDEEGYVKLYDTRSKLKQSATHQENADDAIVSGWRVHNNSVYDLCWTKDDATVLTASADHTVKVWDVEQKECIGMLKGHTGSVKSVCSHPSNFDVIVSGSRDGSFALWDLRCKRQNELWILPTEQVNGAHTSAKRKRFIKGKAASMTVTSVLYLKDEISIATAGAFDSTVKFWDTRNLRTCASQASPHQETTTDTNGRAHGVTSLSQDLNGVLISASCTDNRIYLYNVLKLDKGPISSFTGGQIGSFFVKSSISPDAAHILSGSKDGNAYIWQVKNPSQDPMALTGHEKEKEVTAVDWSLQEPGMIATASDDYTVRFWNVHDRFGLSSGSPCVRRKVTAGPVTDSKERPMDTESPLNSSHNEVVQDLRFQEVLKTPEISAAYQSHRHGVLSGVNLIELFDRTPESAVRSPSSVLTPPSSMKKKTIRDYFVAC